MGRLFGGLSPVVPFCLLLLLAYDSLVIGGEEEGEIFPLLSEEEFSEALLLRPLPDRKVLAHFHFDSRVPPTHSYGPHHRLFPKSIYQLVHKFRVREMELSFTQGRWNYELWGGYDSVSSSNAKPPGVELWAVFDVPQHQVDASWKNLTHALSGLFCASINFLEHTSTYSAPEWSFHSFAGNLRYGTLPREAVCTENLTPWLKLLPCRDKAGLSSLMDRPSIYRGYYHSQRLRLTSNEYDVTKLNNGMVLEQTLTVVLKPSVSGTGAVSSSRSMLQPNWSISSLFGRKLSGKCVVSKSSNVYIQLERNLAVELKKIWKDTGAYEDEILVFQNSRSNPSFEMSIFPKRVIKAIDSSQKDGASILYEFSTEHYTYSKPFDLEFKWKMPVVWSSQQAPFRASRFLMGSGNERGAIAMLLKSTGGTDCRPTSSVDEEGCWLKFSLFQVVPWYVKVYYHTLKVFVDEELNSVANVLDKMRVSPSEDKVSPGVMELMFRVPCNVKSVALSIEFDKGFLHIDEYPPDANQGFDIPSAVLSFPGSQVSMRFGVDSSLNKLPILAKLQEQSPIRSYTEVLLVPLTTPDFSMPYNVITITCTVFALYFGSLLNALRRRVGEEERLLKSRATRTTLLSKLFSKLRGKPSEPSELSSTTSKVTSYKLIAKVILIAAVAAGWQYYFT